MRRTLLIFGLSLLWMSGFARSTNPVLVVNQANQIVTRDGTNNYLSVTFGLTNVGADINRWIIQSSTNGGASWTIGSSAIHSWPATTYHNVGIPEGGFALFRVLVSHSPSRAIIGTSTNIGLWGAGAPASLAVTANGTNAVTLKLQDKSMDETGFYWQKSLTSNFVSVLDSIPAGPSAGKNGLVYATNSSFAQNTPYYFRAFATNALYQTWPYTVISVTPNAMPQPARFYSAHPISGGVKIEWLPGTGSVERWYLDVSVNNTNTWMPRHNAVGGGTRYSTTDSGGAEGTTRYYRLMASNSVGVAYSPIQSVYISPPITNSTWYIDCTATGNNSGTNWANAWPGFSSIAWGNVKPGATIWIAKGHYNETAYATEGNGIAGSPIRFKVAQDAAHKGKVYLNSFVTWRQWIWLDGAADDNYVPTSTEDITNNINLVLGSTNIQLCYVASVSPMEGISVKWVECAKVANPEKLKEDHNIFGEGSTAGIMLKSDQGLTNNEVAYIWCHDLEGDGLSFALSKLTNWCGVNVHHSIVERGRGNMLSGTGGDYHDLILHDEWRKEGVDAPPGVHPDGAQMYPPYLRMWNNVIRDTTGLALYMELMLTNTYGIHLYNNIVYGTGAITNLTAVRPASGIAFTTEPSARIPVMTVSNVFIANNTFYGFDAGYLTVTRRDTSCDLLELRDWTVANNLFYNMVASTTGSQQEVSDQDYTTLDVIFNWNDACGRNTCASYKGTNYSTMSALGAATGFGNNFSYTPSMINAAYRAGRNFAYDFHLTGADAQHMVGTNLSAYESKSPGISRNLDGTSRSATGWPVGAMSRQQGDGLVTWLNFNGWSGGDLVDSSPMGNNAVRLGSPLNFPTPMAGPKPGIGGAAFGVNQYLSVTNWRGIDTLTNGTIALWCVFSNALGNSLILDAGYDGSTNSWRFGRVDGGSQTKFTLYDATNGTRMYKITFPDAGASTTNWNHYAVTWDGSHIVGYWNGLPFQTNSQTLDALRIHSAHHWMGVGTLHHEGTPQWADDEYPNCCWLNGALADVRIYNQPLSSAEMLNLYQSDDLGVYTPPSGPAGSNAAGVSLRGKYKLKGGH